MLNSCFLRPVISYYLYEEEHYIASSNSGKICFALSNGYSLPAK